MKRYRWLTLSVALLAALTAGCADGTQPQPAANGMTGGWAAAMTDPEGQEDIAKMISESAADYSIVTMGTEEGPASGNSPPESAPSQNPAEPLTDLRQREAGEIPEAGQIDAGHPDWYFTSDAIHEGDAVYNRIIGKSYRENDRISLSDLRYLKVLHYNYRHEIQVGELIANQKIAADLLEIFKELYQKEYEIESMFLVDNYWPEPGTADAGVTADENSMMSNNTSCFNYRVVPGKKSLSNHALGLAIDINPYQNPYVIFDKNGKQVLEAGGDPSYINRKDKRPHMIDHEDPAFLIFTNHGFRWGGDWHSSRDYQHFEKVK